MTIARESLSKILMEYVLRQLKPFPENPVLHSQPKAPLVLVQIPLGEHGFVKHSLISKNKIIINQIYNVCSCAINVHMHLVFITYPDILS
jgi:hypothetical protein